MRWRVLLQGHEFDLDALGRLFPDGDMVIIQQDDYWYLAGDRIIGESADEARHSAMNVLPLINGIGRVHDASYRPVRLADSVINEDTLQTRHVFAEVRMKGRSRLTIGGDPPRATPLRSKID